MLYPKSIESKLGFDTLRSLLIDLCQSEGGKVLVQQMRFITSFPELTTLLHQTSEMTNLVNQGLNINMPALEHRELLHDIKVEGTYLEGDVLLSIADVLQMALKVSAAINKEEETQLKELSSLVGFEIGLPNQVTEKFDRKGNLKDSASPELAKIRKDHLHANRTIRKTLQQVFKQAESAGIVPENSQPTFRDGRFVIPVVAANKRQIKGFIHDESATGQTVYLEPSEVLETNNRIVELNHKERRETIRIFKLLTTLVRDNLETIDNAFQYLSLIDFIHAKALLAIKLDATLPEVSKDPGIVLREARHPILYLNHKKENKQVIPLSVDLDKINHTLLISGPNAGGKSVCLKTVGLIQYMFQCGLLVPAKPDSLLGIYKDVFVDMGDEQSIENDLSTYSSHLTNMRLFLEKAQEDSLVLIDEFGTGTDPEFGGAIAEAILGILVKNGASAIITTHYGNLKEAAQSWDGIRNAAMQFDLQKLIPLYKLEMDKPGSSFALEVAHKIGLPENVLKKAKEIVGSDSVEVENLINKLTSEKRQVEEKLEAVKTKEQELNRSLQKYRSLQKKLDDQSKEIIQKAKIEAEALLYSTNQRIEKTIRHIKENKAQKQETRKIRKGLESFKSSIKAPKEQQKLAPEGITFLPGEIRVGDYVLNEQSNISGEVQEIKGEKVRLIVGDLQTQVKLKFLKKVVKPANKQGKRAQSLDLNTLQSQFLTHIDLRGKRSVEIAGILDKFIDDALLLGHHELKILHGKGDGVLRNVVRTHLKSYPQVFSMQDEHEERGGSGITVIALK